GSASSPERRWSCHRADRRPAIGLRGSLTSPRLWKGKSLAKRQEKRRLHIGAEPVAGGTSFRVWAPGRSTMAVVGEGRASAELAPEEGGYFGGTVAGLGPGDRYRVQPDGGDWVPDPASRFQPDGPNGPSEIVDGTAFAWSDA